MAYKSLILNSITFQLSHKICFKDFSISIAYGCKIGIIGRNGSGKSTLLNIIRGVQKPFSGSVTIPDGTVFGYVPQVVQEYNDKSGGQRFQQALTDSLDQDTNVLLLDEPTNHLDKTRKTALMRMIQRFVGTVIVVSHDVELLQQCVDTIWHIDQGAITVFNGGYDEYMQQAQHKKDILHAELHSLQRQKKELHKALMKEQERASKRKTQGKKKKVQKRWMPSAADQYAQKAEITSGKKSSAIDGKKSSILDKLSDLYIVEEIIPTFFISAGHNTSKQVISVVNATVGYKDEELLVKDIYLSIMGDDRIAIMGDNGSGKSTVIKALLQDVSVIKAGEWDLPDKSNIGYLDQDYQPCNTTKTVLELMHDRVPDWDHNEIRTHLNRFLFRKNEEINMPALYLSGGEKARLCLALIAANTPRILILDEVTNNLDLETRKHVVQVIKAYPGALIVISHDQGFLEQISIKTWYQIKNKSLVLL